MNRDIARSKLEKGMSFSSGLRATLLVIKKFTGKLMLHGSQFKDKPHVS
jgi:hypothetical protein